MSKLRRYFKFGDIIFITNVTYNRIPILIEHYNLLAESLEKINKVSPFDIIAKVILPDHFHVVLDPLNNNPSTLLQRIKMSFGVSYRIRMKMKSGRIWQNRFWDHIIRDQNDLNNHINYIHYNPVKHGFVTKPIDWKYSSFHEYRNQGVYAQDWGSIEPDNIEGEFGE